ncbi:hypothetical protein LINPERPRIM_LOCUS12943 [Linum perenne]
MDHAIAASGSRSPGLTETVLLEQSSPLTYLPSPWETKLESLCTQKYLRFCRWQVDRLGRNSHRLHGFYKSILMDEQIL